MLFIKFVMGAYLGAFDKCPGTLLMFRVVATSIYYTYKILLLKYFQSFISLHIIFQSMVIGL